MEHNSVMRPLRHLEEMGIELTVIECSEEGNLEPADIKAAIKKNTRALILTHASNVTGTIMPVEEAGRIARDHGIIFCVDAAQTAGALPVNAQEMNIDLLAFTGHKSLFGPQGTGGIYINKQIEKKISHIYMGGTGSKSEYESQPEFMPDRFESGTPNTIGIAGLGAGVDFILDKGLLNIREKEKSHTKMFLDGLESIRGVKVYGCRDASLQTPVVSFNINGMSPSEISLMLDEDFGIMSRPGLQCAPSAHRTIGSFPMGTTRFSFGYFNTEKNITAALEAVEKIALEIKE